jgi:2-polyprenyl-6-methoxyphenol hydroxylase-like FAD-dependent oxidoreductase
MHADVLIVGAGPVGLFLAGLLVQRGVDVAVLDRREHPVTHSRAIGILPPGLEALAHLGLDAEVIAAGTLVRRGVGLGDGRVLGDITFDGAHARYPFVLTLPQARTEQLLSAHLERTAPGTVHRGVEVMGLENHGPDDGAPMRVHTYPVAAESSGTTVWTASVVVGADGAHSRVRTLAGIGVARRDWGDSYLMGDFPEAEPESAPEPDAAGDPARTAAGAQGGPTAVIHLHRDGVVESFPLPDGMRRWVVHTGREQRPELAGDLVGMVRQRRAGGSLWADGGGQREVPGAAVDGLPDPATATMVSAFTVYRQLARRMLSGRTVLVGDAAHALSPIGGQGMTLGWLDALALAPLLAEELAGGLNRGPVAGRLRDRSGFAAYERRRLRAARFAARQAEVNMMLGRPLPAVALQVRDAVARGCLAAGLGPRLARLYAMGWART